jgi:hypothetical protein
MKKQLLGIMVFLSIGNLQSSRRFNTNLTEKERKEFAKCCGGSDISFNQTIFHGFGPFEMKTSTFEEALVEQIVVMAALLKEHNYDSANNTVHT